MRSGGNEETYLPKSKWRKVAYGGMQPGYHDNYMDESFLEDMVMNTTVVKRDLLKVILDSVSITQYISVVALVVLVWMHTLDSTLDENTLLLLDVTLLGLGFLVLLATEEIFSQKLGHYILKVTFFASGLYLLSPVYKTLTRSISSDSIWAVTASLLILHLFLHDYSGSTIRAPGSHQESNVDELHLVKFFCCRFGVHCFSPPFKASCFCFTAVLLTSVPICPTRHLLCQEVLFPVASLVLIFSHGCHFGTGLCITQIVFCVAFESVCVCDDCLPILAY